MTEKPKDIVIRAHVTEDTFNKLKENGRVFDDFVIAGDLIELGLAADIHIMRLLMDKYDKVLKALGEQHERFRAERKPL